MSSIDTNKQAAYEEAYTNFATAGCSESVCEAYTNFKSHEAWGWHLMAPFKEGASVEESNTIQEGIDTYERLWAAVMGLEIPSPSPTPTPTPSPTPSPTPTPSPSPSPTNSYHQLSNDYWKSQNSAYRIARRNFRRFAVKNGQASFVVAKDGACYEDMPLDVKKLLVPGLRLWASVLRLPYASRMRRVELEEALKPVLALLRSAC